MEVMGNEDSETQYDKNDPGCPVAEFSWCSRTEFLAEDQTQIERADMYQLPFPNIFTAAEIASPHRAGFVTVGKRPLDQFPSFLQQTLAVSTFDPPPICIHSL